MADATPISVLMGRVLADLPAIGKNSNAPANMGGYRFRGIEDVLSALNPVFASHGVFVLPSVLERQDSERTVSQNKAMYVVDLHMRFRFFGPAGDWLEADAWGEGTDMGDKATQKAMTAAFKYVLFEVFCIAADDQSQADSDGHSVEESTGRREPAATASRQRDDLYAAWDGWDEQKKADYKQEAAGRGWPWIGQMSPIQVQDARAWANAYNAYDAADSDTSVAERSLAAHDEWQEAREQSRLERAKESLAEAKRVAAGGDGEEPF